MNHRPARPPGPRRRAAQWWLALAAIVLLAAGTLACARPAFAASPLSPAATTRQEQGLPLLQAFAPSVYDGDGQNWAVVQDRRGLVYVANGNKGVLEFDGVRWRRIPLAHHTLVRSLAMDGKGRIYAGAQGELGYLAPDGTGQLRYVSLVSKIPEEQRDFTDVWRIFVVGEDVFFFTSDRLFRLRDGRIRTWSTSTPFHVAFVVDGRLFVRKFGEGLLELIDDELVLVPGGERFSDDKVYVMLPWHPTSDRGAGAREILIGSREKGWLLFDGRNYRPWRTEVDDEMAGSLLYGAAWTRDMLAVGTLQGGLSLLDREGRRRLHLDRATGLADDTVFALDNDRHDGLWLAQGRGITRVAISDALTSFDTRSGLTGRIMAIERHRGVLHAGGPDGVFRLQTGTSANPRFERVEQLPRMIWTLLDTGDSLLVGGLTGVFELRDGQVRQILETPGEAMTLRRSRRDPSRVFVGAAHGLASIRLHDGQWTSEAWGVATTTATYTLQEDAQGQLWIGTQGENVYRVSFPGHVPGAALPAPQISRFGVSDGLAPGLSNVYSVAGEVVFATGRGLLRFDPVRSRFAPAPEFSGLFPEGERRLGPIHEDANGRLWMQSQQDGTGLEEIGTAQRQGDGHYRWDSKALRSIANIPYYAIHVDDDGVAWFGSEDRLDRYDPHAPGDKPAPFDALIRKVTGRDGRVLYGGAGPMPRLKLRDAENALRFEFAAPNFDSMKDNRFQVLLEGVDPDWSDWSSEGYRDYNSIPAGPHRFRVRARDVRGIVGGEAVFEFRVLPPWYLAWWAYLAYVLALAATVTATVRWRSAALHKRNRELAALVQQRTGELSNAVDALREQSVTDPLTGLKNRRYVLDHIDRDLARVDRAYAGYDSQARPENADLLFLLVDIDHFKEVNDRFGHAAGDRVLEQMRDLLLKVSRKVDTPVRWGGEEFLMIARNFNADAATHLAERVRSAVANHEFDLGTGQKLYRTCSVGFAAYPFFRGAPQRLGWEQVVEIADQCLYEAKHRGRNTWVGARSTTPQPPADIESRLHAGITEMAADGTVELAIFGE